MQCKEAFHIQSPPLIELVLKGSTWLILDEFV